MFSLARVVSCFTVRFWLGVWVTSEEVRVYRTSKGVALVAIRIPVLPQTTTKIQQCGLVINLEII